MAEPKITTARRLKPQRNDLYALIITIATLYAPTVNGTGAEIAKLQSQMVMLIASENQVRHAVGLPQLQSLTNAADTGVSNTGIMSHGPQNADSRQARTVRQATGPDAVSPLDPDFQAPRPDAEPGRSSEDHWLLSASRRQYGDFRPNSQRSDAESAPR